MKLKVIDERLLVELEESEEQKTSGGIYIPDTAKEKPQRGKVVAVGTDEDLQKVIKVGDRVIFGKYTGDEIEYDGKKYLVIQRSDVLAIIQ
ncbi:MAG: molecular chaperone GroES [Spirochaetes bacterium DG_61]|jgi:chaperonin GroES|nr:MAG: molecular chaperone GroES [Spirochaetes bacterium DG_61]